MIQEINRPGEPKVYACDICRYRSFFRNKLEECEQVGFHSRLDVALGQTVHLSLAFETPGKGKEFRSVTFRIARRFYKSPSENIPRALLHDPCVTLEAVHFNTSKMLSLMLEDMRILERHDLVQIMARGMDQPVNAWLDPRPKTSLLGRCGEFFRSLFLVRKTA